jgi:hypothetical protein
MYQLSAPEQIAALPGAVSMRDVATFISYYTRVLNLTDEFEDWLQVAAAHTYRPAGSALYGMDDRGIMQIAPSALGATILLPMLQATDTLDSEGILPALECGASTLVEGCMRAAVFLVGTNNLGMAALGDVAPRIEGPLSTRCYDYLRRLTRLTTKGSALTSSALSLACELGWADGFSKAWLSMTPHSGLWEGTHLAIEAEECLPWITAMPNTSAFLGFIKPVHLVSSMPLKVYARTDNVVGRIGIADACYSLHAMGTNAQFYLYTKTQDWPREPVPYVIKNNYRGTPRDGQFPSICLDSVGWEILYKINTGAGMSKARDSHLRRSKWKWTYEWLIPYS